MYKYKFNLYKATGNLNIPRFEFAKFTPMSLLQLHFLATKRFPVTAAYLSYGT